MEHPDRVRENTSPNINRQIDSEIERRIRAYADKDRSAITERIAELDREWDIERVLEANASALGLAGLALGVIYSKKWLVVPGIILPFLLQHAVQGWCPPIPLLRRLSVRTRGEIDREKYALKVLRGDFKSAGTLDPALAALRAVEA